MIHRLFAAMLAGCVASGAVAAEVQVAVAANFAVPMARTPQRLIDAGHAVPGSRFTYALGALVLWSATPGFVDAQGTVLGSGRFQHLALADPKVAPYGAAAMQVLRARGLVEALAPKIVSGESIAQAYQFVATGNAELGFVALSQVQQPGRPIAGSMWRVPASLYAPIRQDAVLLKSGQGNPAATALLQFLQGPAARDIVRAFGYGT
jgi:molybdate transport system substrate-binding protein